ncbi:hypothetical protein ACLOJK_021324 [Asimina triloba]
MEKSSRATILGRLAPLHTTAAVRRLKSRVRQSRILASPTYDRDQQFPSNACPERGPHFRLRKVPEVGPTWRGVAAVGPTSGYGNHGSWKDAACVEEFFPAGRVNASDGPRMDGPDRRNHARFPCNSFWRYFRQYRLADVIQ